MPPGGVHRQDGLLLGLAHFRECVQVADELRRLLRVSVQPDSPVVEPIEQLLIRQIRLRRSRFIDYFIIITIIFYNPVRFGGVNPVRIDGVSRADFHRKDFAEGSAPA